MREKWLMGKSLFVPAFDFKVQINLSPDCVLGYRWILDGYGGAAGLLSVPPADRQDGDSSSSSVRMLQQDRKLPGLSLWSHDCLFLLGTEDPLCL